MTPHLEDSIERLRRRAWLGAFLGTSLRLFAWTAAGLAAVALLLRAAFRYERLEAAWVYAALVVVPIVAWFLARKRVPSRDTTAAWLDVRSGGTGAIVAGEEIQDPRWRSEVERALATQPSLPRLDLARPGRFAFGALAFAALVVAVPIAPALVGPPTVLQEAVLERVEEQLKALEEQVELEPELAAELRENLDRLQREGALAEPEAAFEALDRAQERLEQEAYERAEASQSAQEDLARTAEDASRDPQAAQEQLEKTMQQLAQGGFSKDVQSALEKELGAAGASLPPGTKLGAENIEAISKDLASKLAAKNGELAKKGLLNAKALAKLGELAKLDGFEFNEHVCDASCEKKPGGT
ncbi:MAG: hypothetical protein NTY35_14470 [Planctomycetota bacterium]|nr:hypothetical protein [Planctomycetota bacterium]